MNYWLWVISVVLVLEVIFFFISKEDQKFKDKIYPNIYIDSMSAGGKSKKEIEQFFDQKNQLLASTTFTLVYNNNPVATVSGKQINLHYDGKSFSDRLYLIGRSSHIPTKIYQKIVTQLGLKKFQFTSWIDYDKQPIEETVSYIEEKYNKPAKNALFKFENGRVISFRQEEKGLEIESQSMVHDFESQIDSLKSGGGNKNIVVLSRIIDPEITLTEANSFGIEELIAEGKSDYSHSIAGRVHNVILASSKFNGVLIPKEKTFSFNEIVGDISATTGYQQAYIIKSGKTVLGDGGGVCQVSTTLFRAALNAGLPVIERWAHAYRVGYYENDMKPGFDATVFAPSVDLKIKNDTPASILIETEVDENNNILTFKLFGKKDQRKIEISPAVLYDVQPPPPPSYQDDPTMKKGQTKQIDFAAWGGKAYFNYKVTYPNKQTEEKKFFSSYKPWQAIFLQGTAD